MTTQANLKRAADWAWGRAERADEQRWGVVALACVVLASLAFRLHLSHECSLWLDEVSTHLDSLKPWPVIWHGPEKEHPALLFVLVKVTMGFLGQSETAVRAVSLFFGCVLLVAVYELCLELRLSVGRAVVVISTLALTAFFIRHGTEARQYAIVSALCTLSATRALRLLRGPVRVRDVLVGSLSVVAAAATHYFAIAYALVLLGCITAGVVLRWKKTALSRRLAALGTLLACLVPLGYLIFRLSALGKMYAVGETGGAGPVFNSELLKDTIRNFAFLTNDVCCLVLQPGLALVGLVLLTLRLRGLARALPLGLGIAPGVAAPFVSGQHFIAARYIAPSAVFYHLGACVALFAFLDLIRRKLARHGGAPLLAHAVGALMLLGSVAARLREYPTEFSAGTEDYRALQLYFSAELAHDTALVTYPAFFGELLFKKEYDVGPRLVGLDKFHPIRGVSRYLVVQLRTEPEQRVEAGVFVAKYLGISEQAWSSLPLFPVPHSIYQPAVMAYLVESPSDWEPPAPPKVRHRKGARP